MDTGRSYALWGAWLQLGPLLGILGTIIGMLMTFYGIALGGDESTTSMVAEGISTALVTTQIGFVFGFVGLVLFSIALLKYKFRERWFFWFLVAYSVFSLITFPVGTVIGVLLLIFIIARKDEFLKKEEGVNQSSHTTPASAPR